MNLQDKDQIIQILNKFQNAYDLRDIDNLDTLLKDLFDFNESCVILGTSYSEWCLNYEQIKELFESDFKYWDFEKINIDDAYIDIYDKIAYAFTTGTFSYTFKYYDENYNSMLDYVKDILNSLDKRKLKIKASEINWLLSYFLHQRDHIERKLSIDLKVSFILVKQENNFKIRQIQFSVNQEENNPDIRIYKNNEYENIYDNEKKSLQKYQNNIKDQEIIDIVSSFSNDYLNETVINIYRNYINDKSFIFINFDHKIGINDSSFKSIVKCHKERFNALTINTSDMIINKHKDFAWVVTNGLLEATITEDKMLIDTFNEVNNILSENEESKEKLYKIRRNIANTLKEVAISDNFKWPIRFEALLQQVKGEWKFNMIQFSYPFDYYLDNKNKYMHFLEGKK